MPLTCEQYKMFPFQDSIKVSGVPFVTWLLILANLACYVGELLIPDYQVEYFLSTYSLIPLIFTSNPDVSSWARIFTSMFFHVSLGHVLSNLWFLWIFGDGVEDRIGHFRYLGLYLFAGLCGALMHVAFNPQSYMPVLGASGAISGVLGAYYALFPKATVSTMFIIIFSTRIFQIPAHFYLGLWFCLQILSGLFSQGADIEAGQTAFWAHVGGFLAGILVAKIIEGDYFSCTGAKACSGGEEAAALR